MEQENAPCMERCSCHACSFHVLGVSLGATPDEVLQAWRRMLVVHHPDKCGDASLAKELNQAKERALLSIDTFDCMLARSFKTEGRLEEVAALSDRLRAACVVGRGARRPCLRLSDPGAFMRVRRPRGARRMRWPGVCLK